MVEIPGLRITSNYRLPFSGCWCITGYRRLQGMDHFPDWFIFICFNWRFITPYVGSEQAGDRFLPRHFTVSPCHDGRISGGKLGAGQ